MRIQIAAALSGALLLAACSTTPQALETADATQSTTRTYGQNYQEIYRRVVSTATRCSAGNISAYASFAVDSQLYSELGYGEVSTSLINWGVRNYYWKAKIEKAPGGGSTMHLYSGNTLNNATMLNKVVGWADGDTNC